MVCVGGSDAGIAAALRARELDPDCDVTVVLADEYPNFSIRGIPYLISGEVRDWRDLAHRSVAELEAAGVTVLSNTYARAVRPREHRLEVSLPDTRDADIEYDRLVIATGAELWCRPSWGSAGDPGLGVLTTEVGDGASVLDEVRTSG